MFVVFFGNKRESEEGDNSWKQFVGEGVTPKSAMHFLVKVAVCNFTTKS